MSVTNFEIMPQPPGAREQDAHLAGLAAEAAYLVEPPGRRQRDFAVLANSKFTGENGQVKKLPHVRAS